MKDIATNFSDSVRLGTLSEDGRLWTIGRKVCGEHSSIGSRFRIISPSLVLTVKSIDSGKEAKTGENEIFHDADVDSRNKVL